MTATSIEQRRPTQAERSAGTRERLLDATVECLVELGWSGTSTTEVVRRAGVSRGAQVHHYPTKEDLVLAAVEHLIDRRVAEYQDAFERIPAGERTPMAAFDLLKSTYEGGTFDAWLEFVVAARTTPALHDRFVELELRFRQTTIELFTGLFPEAEADPAFARVALALTFSVLDGMALQRLCGHDTDVVNEVAEAYKVLIAPFFPISQGDAS